MEGTMDSRRLRLTRPTPRPVAPRRAATHVTEPTSVINDQSTKILDVAPAQPHFSKLTPIYQPSPVNTVDAISGPRVKGIEFIKPVSHHKKAQSHHQTQESPDEPFIPHLSHKLEYLENNLEAVDLDLLGGVIDDEKDVAEVFGAALQPVGSAPVNYIEQYFNRTNSESTIKHHIKTLVPRVKDSIKKVNRKHVHRIGVLSILTGVIAFGGYLLADSFFVNQEAKAVLGQDTSSVVEPALTEPATTTPTAQAATTPDPTPAVSTTASNAVGYTAPADQPKFITIKKLGIHAPVVSLGLTSTGAVDTPKNIWDAAWFNGSAKPGTDGAALIDGHSSATRGALFGNLDRLVAGDQIQIERGDGTMLTYSVAYTAIVNRNNVDMASMLKPYGGASKGLNLITCTGKWIDSEKTLENRVLVYAQQI